MVGLTSKQREELNVAIHEYLVKNRFTNSAQIFAEETGIQDEDSIQNSKASTSLGIKDVLEKKWTSVAKLKKQNIELERQNKQFKEQMVCERCGGGTSQIQGGASNIAGAVGDGLPRQPEKYTLLGHRQRITKVQIHPIYQVVASSSEDGSIKLWDYEQGELETTMKSHTGCVNYISFHQSGKFLASCATDQTIKLWDLQTHSVYKTLQGHEHEVSCVEYLPGGDQIVSCSRDNTIKIWDTSSGYCLQTIPAHSEWIRKVAVNLKGSLLASASKDESIIVWNLEKLKDAKNNTSQQQDSIISVLREHENQIDCIVWAPPESCLIIDNADYNKNFLASLSMQNNDAQGNGDYAGSLATPGFADSSQSPLEESKDNGASGGGQEKMTTKEKIQQMKLKMQARKKKDDGSLPEEEKKQQPSNHIVLSDDVQRDYLASAARDKTIKIWEVRNCRCVVTLQGHDNWVTDLVFHPGGKYLLSSSDDKSLRIWDLSNGRCYRKIQNAHDHFVSSIDMKAKVVVTGSVDKTLKVWTCR